MPAPSTRRTRCHTSFAHPGCVLLALLAVGATGGSAQEARVASVAGGEAAVEDRNERLESGAYFFHRPVEYGSATVVGFAPLLLNRGFHISRAYRGAVDLRETFDGATTLWASITRPLEAIRTGGGTRAFLRTELFPFRYDFSASWVSNYVGHTLETGIAYRTLAEYYDAQGTSHPRLRAGLASVATTALVEMYENRAGQGRPQRTTVADFFIFDPLGILLFSSDGVSAFFSRKLGARIWPSQPGLSLRDGLLSNVGLDVVFRVGLPVVEGIDLFSRVGMGQDIGLSWERGDGLSYSLAFGWSAKDPVTDPETGEEHVGIAPSASMFIDRSGSLLGSVVWSTNDARALAVNVYPGALPFLGEDLGAWLVVTDWGRRVSLGLSHRSLQGLGLGL